MRMLARMSMFQHGISTRFSHSFCIVIDGELSASFLGYESLLYRAIHGLREGEKRGKRTKCSNARWAKLTGLILSCWSRVGPQGRVPERHLLTLTRRHAWDPSSWTIAMVKRRRKGNVRGQSSFEGSGPVEEGCGPLEDLRALYHTRLYGSLAEQSSMQAVVIALVLELLSPGISLDGSCWRFTIPQVTWGLSYGNFGL